MGMPHADTRDGWQRAVEELVAALPARAITAAAEGWVVIAVPAAASPAGAPCPRALRRASIMQHIEANLGDPTLAPATLAAQLRMSPRYLHGLFAEIGTSVMRWVLARRLARCRIALADPAQAARSISEIAFGLGFQDLSHAGRAFKAAYGVTPRAWRAASLSRSHSFA